MTKAQDRYDARPWIAPAPMPPGHYDLDDCGGVHVRPDVVSGRAEARAAWEQARTPKSRVPKPAPVAPNKWHDYLCFVQFGIFHAFDDRTAKYNSTPTTPIYADAVTLCGLGLHVLGATVHKAEADPVAVHPTPICRKCLAAIMVV